MRLIVSKKTIKNALIFCWLSAQEKAMARFFLDLKKGQLSCSQFCGVGVNNLYVQQGKKLRTIGMFITWWWTHGRPSRI